MNQAPFDIDFSNDLADVPWLDFDHAGTFAADGAAIVGIAGTFSFDTRPLVPLIGGSGDDELCALYASFGVTCRPCRDGEPFCVDVAFEGRQAVEVPGLTLVPRNAADIAADPNCP